MESERMNEIEKMRNGLLADFTAPEVQESFRHCKTLLARFLFIVTTDMGSGWGNMSISTPDAPFWTVPALQ